MNNLVVTANGVSGISVFNVLNGLNPVRVAEIDTPGTAVSVACFGSLIAVADYTGGLAIVAFMQFNDVGKSLYISGAAFLITSLEGFLLTPMLMGRAESQARRAWLEEHGNEIEADA